MSRKKRAIRAFQMMWQFQRRVVTGVVRMKSSSSRGEGEAATTTCTVPFFSPRDYTRHIREFDEIIDVRSPGEFEEDHIPGAGHQFSLGLIDSFGTV